MKWSEKKSELENFIAQGKSYEEIGRIYGCTGSNIKKVCKRLDIILERRRKINPKETFNKGKAKKGTCQNCGKEFVLYSGSGGKYCSHKCQKEKEYNDYIERWKNGKEDGLSGKYSLSKRIRKYFFNKYDCKCQKCGWGEINEFTNRTPLQIHHIDGNCFNNREENLELLCPNCHSLTENFGSRNTNASKGRSEYFCSENRKVSR